MLKYYKDIFDGTLGELKYKPEHAKLKPYVTHTTDMYYPVPHINIQTLKYELKFLTYDGVIRAWISEPKIHNCDICYWLS